MVSGKCVTAIGAERLCRERGGFAGTVGLMEKLESYAETIEPVGGSEQVAFGGNPAENEVRMRAVGGEKVTGSLDSRVSGLHHDLGGGQIPPDEYVLVFELGKGGGHGILV